MTLNQEPKVPNIIENPSLTLSGYMSDFQLTQERLMDGRILDIGAGLGKFSKAVKDNYGIDVVSIDNNPEMWTREGKGKVDDDIEYVKGDIYHLPFPDETFNLVLARAVVGQTNKSVVSFDEIKTIVEEAYRVLTKGGELRIAPGQIMLSYKLDEYFRRLNNQTIGMISEEEKSDLRKMEDSMERVKDLSPDTLNKLRASIVWERILTNPNFEPNEKQQVLIEEWSMDESAEALREESLRIMREIDKNFEMNLNTRENPFRNIYFTLKKPQ